MPEVATRKDEKFMQRALHLAQKGRNKTFPNPLVGACIVKNSKLIGEGYHACFGGPHAEIVALTQAGKAACGATLYVTLEPCTHYGKTPPCMDAIINAKLKRVVVAMLDPNPVTNARGVGILKAAGIEVEVGLMQRQATELNSEFIDYITKRH